MSIVFNKVHRYSAASDAGFVDIYSTKDIFDVANILDDNINFELTDIGDDSNVMWLVDGDSVRPPLVSYYVNYRFRYKWLWTDVVLEHNYQETFLCDGRVDTDDVLTILEAFIREVHGRKYRVHSIGRIVKKQVDIDLV